MTSGVLWFELVLFLLSLLARTFLNCYSAELMMIISGMEISDGFSACSYPFNQNWINVIEMKQLKELVLATKNRLK